MDRPNIKLIKESLEFLSGRMLKGTIRHLIDYIEYLEKPKEPKDEGN